MVSSGNSSHAEIWDDSALVDSWNDALEEYKKYHSIQARGENEDEILKAAESVTPETGESMVYEEGQVDESVVTDPGAKDDGRRETVGHDTISPKKNAQPKKIDSAAPTQVSSGPPALPQHLIGQVHDESLKNLLMSWYYAGYYTGLYEGQQQGKAETHAKHKA